MNAINKIFKKPKPVIGMLHLDYLEGEKFKGIDYVVKKAIKDIKSLFAGGIDGILVENWKEESLGEFVTPATKENFTEVVNKIVKHIKVPYGINVLNNDYKVAFTVAKAVNASFVELDVFVDNVQSDFQSNPEAIKNPFVITPSPKKIMAFAKSIDASNIPVFVFVQPKHYIMIDKEKTIEESTKEAVREGASAILVTKATGFAPTINLIKRVKNAAGKVPVGIGSGFNIENAKEFISVVDFAIVGTSIKIDNETDNPVDKNKVKKLMSSIKGFTKKQWKELI